MNSEAPLTNDPLLLKAINSYDNFNNFNLSKNKLDLPSQNSEDILDVELGNIFFSVLYSKEVNLIKISENAFSSKDSIIYLEKLIDYPYGSKTALEKYFDTRPYKSEFNPFLIRFKTNQLKSKLNEFQNIFNEKVSKSNHPTVISFNQNATLKFNLIEILQILTVFSKESLIYSLILKLHDFTYYDANLKKKVIKYTIAPYINKNLYNLVTASKYYVLIVSKKIIGHIIKNYIRGEKIKLKDLVYINRINEYYKN